MMRGSTYKQQLADCELQSPERRIANAMRNELGVVVNEQALRIFVRIHWEMLSKAAHEIHGSR